MVLKAPVLIFGHWNSDPSEVQLNLLSAPYYPQKVQRPKTGSVDFSLHLVEI